MSLAVARDSAIGARFLLREALASLDGSPLREHAAMGLAACADLLEAIDDLKDAEIRQWAIDHNEYGKEAA